MRRSLLMSAAALGLVLAGAEVHAQPSVSQTQNPPAPNAQQSDLGQAPNSLPRGGATGATVAPGGALGGQTPTSGYSADSAPGVNTLHPLHPPRRQAAHRVRRRHVTHPAPASSSDASPLLATTSAA